MTASEALGALETLRPPANSRGKHVSWVLAVAMHVTLAAFLIYGIQWQTKPSETVSVELVRALPPINAAPPAPTEPAKPDPVPEPAIEPPPKTLPESPKPIAKPVSEPAKPDIALKQKEKPKPQVERPKPAAEKPLPVTVPPPNPFADQLKKETTRIAKQKEADKAQKELEQLRQEQAASANKKLTDAWIARIQATVRGNIVLPSPVKGNPEAVFEVTQLPSGEILNVRLKQSCGIPMLDTAIERAILKSSPLPKPDRPDLFERALELRVRPADKESI